MIIDRVKWRFGVNALGAVVDRKITYAALVGAVLVEGQGLGRALGLLRSRWWATGVRMLLLGGVYWAFTRGSGWVVAQVVDAGGPGWLGSLVAAVLTVPAVVVQTVVMAVTYAELRGRSDGPGTGGLAAGLAGAPVVGAVRRGFARFDTS